MQDQQTTLGWFSGVNIKKDFRWRKTAAEAATTVF